MRGVGGARRRVFVRSAGSQGRTPPSVTAPPDGVTLGSDLSIGENGEEVSTRPEALADGAVHRTPLDGVPVTKLGILPVSRPEQQLLSSILRLRTQWTSRMSARRQSQLSIVEPKETQAGPARPDGSRRRRLSHEEEREIGRLYAETSTPTSEIRARFGIGDSSLYRVVQRRGLALRGRTASSTRPSFPRAPSPAARRRSSTASGAQPAVSRPRSLSATVEVHPSPRVDGGSSRGPMRRGSVTGATTSPAERASSQTGGGARQRFRIRFEGESVFEAKDIQDALRQAESLGATEITAVARED